MSRMTQEQLANRWHMSPRTLEQWRWLGKGPKFLKIGAHVIYRDEDVEDYEKEQLCQNTSGPLPAEDE
jgi:predicted site-specific integrase-resolvase